MLLLLLLLKVKATKRRGQSVGLCVTMRCCGLKRGVVASHAAGVCGVWGGVDACLGEAEASAGLWRCVGTVGEGHGVWSRKRHNFDDSVL